MIASSSIIAALARVAARKWAMTALHFVTDWVIRCRSMHGNAEPPGYLHRRAGERQVTLGRSRLHGGFDKAARHRGGGRVGRLWCPDTASMAIWSATESQRVTPRAGIRPAGALDSPRPRRSVVATRKPAAKSSGPRNRWRYCCRPCPLPGPPAPPRPSGRRQYGLRPPPETPSLVATRFPHRSE